MFIKIDLSEKPKIIIEQNKSVIELNTIKDLYSHFSHKTSIKLEQKIKHALEQNIELITIKI